MGKKYDLERVQVLVTWEEFLPNGKEPSSEKTILFFPGWPLKEGPVKGMRRIGEEFANNFGTRTYLFYSQSKQIVTHPSYYHAQAVCRFLAEKEIKHIILVGYSQGGVKAIDTIVRLQEMNLDICVEGLILINSAGLNDIGKWTFLRREFADLTIKTWLTILRESAREPSLRKKFISLLEHIAVLRGARDFFFAIWVDVRPSLRNFLARFNNEVVEGTTRSPYLDQVGIPVVIIQGVQDDSFDTDKILTQGKAQPDTFQLHDTRAKCSPLCSREKQIPVEDLFPNSPYVRLMRAHRFGTHLLPFFRPRAVAQASFYLLRDFNEVLDFEF